MSTVNYFFRRAPEVRFREGYGMTEMAPAVTFVRGTHLVTGGSTGQLVPNSSMKVKTLKRLLLRTCWQVLDLVTGEELGVGETGELCFKGPQVSSFNSSYELLLNCTIMLYQLGDARLLQKLRGHCLYFGGWLVPHWRYWLL